jgi:hypothetical protein
MNGGIEWACDFHRVFPEQNTVWQGSRCPFLGEGQEWFRFEDLMFEAERCMQRVRTGFNGALKEPAV